MREIKFRAWDKQNKKMWAYEEDGNEIGFCIDSLNNTIQVIDLENEQRLEIPVKIMQYTGLKDKNGKEIYEGDILLTNRWKTFSEKRYVSFNDGSFTVTNIPLLEQKHNTFSIYGITDILSGVLKQWEVIGNIYENPELLEEGINE